MFLWLITKSLGKIVHEDCVTSQKKVCVGGYHMSSGIIDSAVTQVVITSYSYPYLKLNKIQDN